ncbi:thiamine phosphate synthase [Thermoflavimicrobium dichotomicum]|uniref:Thiamine-phosphate synthase n=1 Tax=Thermoflavimicrobium dichotomicum TaxID=46223 RepID=A0A1I3L814_9BACL|nr:thiamine phosphate synthase [Thermoflavimicrobium dichotomicum]SFI80942.1 thiamine-phosphate pyrophosphorylase [Thermoflavimicrobium dichotomicum]
MLDLSMYLVMGSQDCPNHDPITILEQAIEGGITCFQFREKNSGRSWADIIALGKRLRQICADHQIPFIVNDRVDLGMILEADGIHVGQDDLPAAEVRKLIGSHRILGVSAKTTEQAHQAVQNGADYIGVGPMFETVSKPDASAPIGPEAIKHIRKNLPQFPIVGIGGITPERTAPVISAGADGVAVISAITQAESPLKATQRFIEQIALARK